MSSALELLEAPVKEIPQPLRPPLGAEEDLTVLDGVQQPEDADQASRPVPSVVGTSAVSAYTDVGQGVDGAFEFDSVMKSITKIPRTKAEYLRELNRAIPLNEYGLPAYIYRCDLVDPSMDPRYAPYLVNAVDIEPPTSTTSDQAHNSRGCPPASLNTSSLRNKAGVDVASFLSDLQFATVELSYFEGFPTLPNGRAFWEQMDHEAARAHQAFSEYLSLIESPLTFDERGRVASVSVGARRLQLCTSAPLEELVEWYHHYYWDVRTRAYDLFLAASYRRLRERRAMESENRHHVIAEKFMQKLEKWLDSADFQDELFEMDPSKAAAILDKLVKIQRVSIGLSANGSVEERTPGATMELHFRQMAAQAGVQKSDKSQIDMSKLLQDPKTLQAAQELVLKIGLNGGQLNQ